MLTEIVMDGRVYWIILALDTDMYYGNWIYDLYVRIDAETSIPYVKQTEYRTEIHWAYRLGYLSHEEYAALMDYLENQIQLKEADGERLQKMRMAQIAYNQNLIRQDEQHREEIRNLFLRHCRYDRQTRQYYYKSED